MGRVRQLAKHDVGARKLVHTGAVPQNNWSASVRGIAPTVLNASRGKLVQAVFPFSWKGLCTTTVIHTVWGPDKDPAINVPSGVVLDLFKYLRDNKHMVEEIQEVWPLVRDHLRSGVKWLRVGGPLAGVEIGDIVTLRADSHRSNTEYV